MGNSTSESRENVQVTEPDAPLAIDKCPATPPTCGPIRIQYSAEPFKTSWHLLQASYAFRGIWFECSHSITGHAFQLNDHTVVSFPADREASLLYAYDSSQDTFSKYTAEFMDSRERHVTAAANSAFNSMIIYAVTHIEGGESLHIISFDLRALRWECVARISKFGGTQKIVGAVMVEHKLLVVGKRDCWVFDVISREMRVAQSNLDAMASITKEVNLCYMRNTRRVLMVVHGDSMYTLRLIVTADECNVIAKRSDLQIHGNREFISDYFVRLQRFGCVVTDNGEHALLFTESGSIMVINTRTWNAALSKVRCPKESRGKNGLFAWVLTNTDKRGRAVDGFVREEYGQRMCKGVANVIQSYYDDGTWFVHLFMRNNGLHWACDLDSILNVHQLDAENASEAERDVECNHALFRLGIQD